MYISQVGLQAVHDDVVNDRLRRSELRRILKEQKSVTGIRARAWSPGAALTALVRSMLRAVARA